MEILRIRKREMFYKNVLCETIVYGIQKGQFIKLEDETIKLPRKKLNKQGTFDNINLMGRNFNGRYAEFKVLEYIEN